MTRAITFAMIKTEDLREAPRKSSPQVAPNLQKTSPQLIENFYASQLDTLGLKLRPGTLHRKDSKETPRTSRRCKSLVYQTLEKLPAEHREQLRELTLFYTPDGRRGLGGSNEIVLRCLNVEDFELVSVLTHEIGHLVDGNLFTGTGSALPSGFYDFDAPVKSDDESLLFYQISWNSDKEKKESMTQFDFVSRYAMTDPFEDFAETYAYFRLHGAEFRELASRNESLNKKYAFMKDYVFQAQEFDTGSDAKRPLNVWTRNYDVTVLPFDIKKFL